MLCTAAYIMFACKVNFGPEYGTDDGPESPADVHERLQEDGSLPASRFLVVECQVPDDLEQELDG